MDTGANGHECSDSSYSTFSFQGSVFSTLTSQPESVYSTPLVRTMAPKKRRKQVDDHEEEICYNFTCDPCDRFYKDQEQLTKHFRVHKKCGLIGCSFEAAAGEVLFHKKAQHNTGYASRIIALKSPEETEKWRKERKERFPKCEIIPKIDEIPPTLDADAADNLKDSDSDNVVDTKTLQSDQEDTDELELCEDNKDGVDLERTEEIVWAPLQNELETFDKQELSEDDDDRPTFESEEVNCEQHLTVETESIQPHNEQKNVDNSELPKDEDNTFQMQQDDVDKSEAIEKTEHILLQHEQVQVDKPEVTEKTEHALLQNEQGKVEKTEKKIILPQKDPEKIKEKSKRERENKVNEPMEVDKPEQTEDKDRGRPENKQVGIDKPKLTGETAEKCGAEDTLEPTLFFCDSCEGEEFLSRKEFDSHFLRHAICGFGGCGFHALRQLLRAHKDSLHDDGTACKVVWKLKSDAEIKVWIETRRKNFPRSKNIVQQEVENGKDGNSFPCCENIVHQANEKVKESVATLVNELPTDIHGSRVWCDTCEKGPFLTPEELRTHLRSHLMCGIKGCRFHADGVALIAHKNAVHENNNFYKVWRLNSVRHIQRWKETRRKNFPTIPKSDDAEAWDVLTSRLLGNATATFLSNLLSNVEGEVSNPEGHTQITNMQPLKTGATELYPEKKIVHGPNFCQPCNKSYRTRKLLMNCVTHHQKCNIAGCQFEASTDVLSVHKRIHETPEHLSKIVTVKMEEETLREEKQMHRPVKPTDELKSVERKVIQKVSTSVDSACSLSIQSKSKLAELTDENQTEDVMSNIPSSTVETSSIFSCDACEFVFYTDMILSNHRSRHSKCGLHGCGFETLPGNVALHRSIIQHVANCNLLTVWQHESPENLQNWKEERRKRFPRLENLKQHDDFVSDSLISKEKKRKKQAKKNNEASDLLEGGKQNGSTTVGISVDQSAKQHSGEGALSNLPSSKDETSSIFSCDACEFVFYSDVKLSNHRRRHSKCGLHGCGFEALPGNIELHQSIIQHVANCNLLTIWQHESLENLQNWKEERRKRFPRLENLKQRTENDDIVSDSLISKEKKMKKRAKENKEASTLLKWSKQNNTTPVGKSVAQLAKQQTGEGALSNIPSRKDETSSIFSCDACECVFFSDEGLSDHRSEHSKCGLNGCGFEALSQIIALHQSVIHVDNYDLFKVLQRTASENLLNWKEERRKRFPRLENLKHTANDDVLWDSLISNVFAIAKSASVANILSDKDPTLKEPRIKGHKLDSQSNETTGLCKEAKSDYINQVTNSVTLSLKRQLEEDEAIWDALAASVLNIAELKCVSNILSKRSQIFSCDACDNFFSTDEQLRAHRVCHIMCDVQGCRFEAHIVAVRIHIQALHTGACDMSQIWQLDSPKKIKNWKEERKKLFPKFQNMKQRSEKGAQRSLPRPQETVNEVSHVCRSRSQGQPGTFQTSQGSDQGQSGSHPQQSVLHPTSPGISSGFSGQHYGPPDQQQGMVGTQGIPVVQNKGPPESNLRFPGPYQYPPGMHQAVGGTAPPFPVQHPGLSESIKGPPETDRSFPGPYQGPPGMHQAVLGTTPPFPVQHLGPSDPIQGPPETNRSFPGPYQGPPGMHQAVLGTTSAFPIQHPIPSEPIQGHPKSFHVAPTPTHGPPPPYHAHCVPSTQPSLPDVSIPPPFTPQRPPPQHFPVTQSKLPNMSLPPPVVHHKPPKVLHTAPSTKYGPPNEHCISQGSNSSFQKIHSSFPGPNELNSVGLQPPGPTGLVYDASRLKGIPQHSPISSLGPHTDLQPTALSPTIAYTIPSHIPPESNQGLADISHPTPGTSISAPDPVAEKEDDFGDLNDWAIQRMDEDLRKENLKKVDLLKLAQHTPTKENWSKVREQTRQVVLLQKKAAQLRKIISDAQKEKLSEQLKSEETMNLKLSKVEVQDKPNRSTFFCDACEVDCQVTENWTKHVSHHKMCCLDGCRFEALSYIVTFHEDEVHKTGYARKILKATSPEEVEIWKAERRKNFPIPASVDEGQKVIVESVERITGNSLNTSQSISLPRKVGSTQQDDTLASSKAEEPFLPKSSSARMSVVPLSISQSDTNTEVKFFCDTCDVDFSTQLEYDEHCKEHFVCDMGYCRFEADRYVFGLHIQWQHHVSGWANRIWRLNTPELLANWLKERKKHFPRQSKSLQQDEKITAERSTKPSLAKESDPDLVSEAESRFVSIWEPDEKQMDHKYFCDPCDVGFHTEYQYTRHSDHHFVCERGNCRFAGDKEIFALHIEWQHATGYAARIWQLNVPAELASWKKERKKYFPLLEEDTSSRVKGSSKNKDEKGVGGLTKISVLNKDAVKQNLASKSEAKKANTCEGRRGIHRRYSPDKKMSGDKKSRKDADSCKLVSTSKPESRKTAHASKRSSSNDKKRKYSPIQDQHRKLSKKESPDSRHRKHSPIRHNRDSLDRNNRPLTHTRSPLSRSRSPSSFRRRSPLRRSRSPSYRSRSPSYRSRSPSYRSRSPSRRSHCSSRRSRSPSRRSRSPSQRSRSPHRKDIPLQQGLIYCRRSRSPHSEGNSLQQGVIYVSRSRSPHREDISLQQRLIYSRRSRSPHREGSPLQQGLIYCRRSPSYITQDIPNFNSGSEMEQKEYSVPVMETLPHAVALKMLEQSGGIDDSQIRALREELLTDLVKESFGDSLAVNPSIDLGSSFSSTLRPDKLYHGHAESLNLQNWQTAAPLTDEFCPVDSRPNNGNLLNQLLKSVNKNDKELISQQLARNREKISQVGAGPSGLNLSRVGAQLDGAESLSSQANFLNAKLESQKVRIAQHIASILSTTGQSEVSDDVLAQLVQHTFTSGLQ